MANTTTVATLGPQVRLVVFKFLVRSDLVPDFVPRVPVNRTDTAPSVRGKQILPSTRLVWLTPFVVYLLENGY